MDKLDEWRRQSITLEFELLFHMCKNNITNSENNEVVAGIAFCASILLDNVFMLGMIFTLCTINK